MPKKKAPTAAVSNEYGAPAGASPTLCALYKALHVPAKEGPTPWEVSIAKMHTCTWQEAPANFTGLRRLYLIALEIFGQFRKHDKSNGSKCLELVVANNTRRMRRLLRETRVRTLQDAIALRDCVTAIHAEWLESWQRQEAYLKKALQMHIGWNTAKVSEFFDTCRAHGAADIRHRSM